MLRSHHLPVLDCDEIAHQQLEKVKSRLNAGLVAVVAAQISVELAFSCSGFHVVGSACTLWCAREGGATDGC